MRHLNGSCSTTSEDGDDFLHAYVAPSSAVSGIAYDVRSQSTRKRCAGWGVDVGSQPCDANQGVTSRSGVNDVLVQVLSRLHQMEGIESCTHADPTEPNTACSNTGLEDGCGLSDRG